MSDLRRALEHFKSELKAAARADARHRDLPRRGASDVEQLCERPIGRGAVDDENRRCVHQIAERLKAGERIVV